MIVDVLSAITYAQTRADALDEPITIYYIPYHNIYAFGRIGSFNDIQHLYPHAKIIKIVEMSPRAWQIDIEEDI